ncbi:uncharacterized protein [Amphiura filiformis]|uniref:uncharacterized protein n=1 Tax=Amphiura filiformis TaxID=82378 RepID=UPI003B21FEA9
MPINMASSSSNSATSTSLIGQAVTEGQPRTGWGLMNSTSRSRASDSSVLVPPVTTANIQGALGSMGFMASTSNASAFPTTVTASSGLGIGMTGMGLEPPMVSFPIIDPLSSVCSPLGVGLPQTITTKIVNGEYVDFGVMLAKSESMGDEKKEVMLSVNETGKVVWYDHRAKRPINSIHTWTSVFLTYAAVYLRAHPHRAQEMLKYANIVRTAATRHAGYGWRSYDIQFRMRQQSHPQRSWAIIDGELWSFYVTTPKLPVQAFRAGQTGNTGASFKGGLGKNARLETFEPQRRGVFESNRKEDFKMGADKTKRVRGGQESQSRPACASATMARDVPGHSANFCTNAAAATSRDMGHEIVRKQVNQATTRSSSQCFHRNLCLCRKYESPIKLTALTPLLDLYPKKQAAVLLREGFSNGFRLGYMGERVTRESPNLKSVADLHDKVLEKIDKEVRLGRIAGPFKQRPLSNLIVSPVGLVPKAEPGKYRMIQHLSYPDEGSINDGIDRAYCAVEYTKFDVAVNVVVRVGKGAMMAKADIESAFRLLPVHPDDFGLLGMKIGDDYYVDKALPMGASCSPALFETFSTFLEWAAKSAAATENIVHFADDFLLVSEESSCYKLVESFEKVCDKLGVPLAKDKSVGPTTKIVYLGLQIDSIEQVVSIPQEKIQAIITKVEKAIQATKLTLKELQSLIGSLSFVCKAIAPEDHSFVRLINLTCGAKKNLGTK